MAEKYKYTVSEIEEYWDAIAGMMDDEIREDLHSLMAPCTEIEFFRAYVKRDPDFGFEEIPEEFRYLSVSEKTETGDMWIEVFESLDEANSHADNDWRHLTPKEKKNFRDFVVKVYRSYLTEDAVDEDGVVDWSVCHSWTTDDADGYYFDSSN